MIGRFHCKRGYRNRNHGEQVWRRRRARLFGAYQLRDDQLPIAPEQTSRTETHRDPPGLVAIAVRLHVAGTGHVRVRVNGTVRQDFAEH